MLQARIGAQRAEEGFLPGVLGGLARKQPAEVPRSPRGAPRRNVRMADARRPSSSVTGQRPGGELPKATAVVGHVEWVRFASVERVPKPGEIIQAREHWLEPAGGGAVAAVELLRLAGNCDFFVAVGNDETGPRGCPEALGRHVHAVTRAVTSPAARVHVPRATTASGRSRSSARSSTHTAATRCRGASWRRSTLSTSAQVTVMRCGPHGRLACSSPARELPTRRRRCRAGRARPQSTDPEETYEPGQIEPAPKLVVTTRGREGGSYRAGDREGLVRSGRLPAWSRTPTEQATPSPPVWRSR